jgi:hypothetical protein
MIYPKGHEFEYKTLKPSQLKIDPLYQRPLEVKRVEQITKEFDGDIFNEPKVSFRDGAYWIFNGQHSVAAWKKYHNNEDKPLTCKVYRGMTWLDECEAFIKQNGLDKDPTTNEKLRAAFNSNDPDVVDMVKKSELCGYTVDFVISKTPTRIVATSALLRAYKSLGSDVFLDMMTAIRDAWYGDMDAISTQILSGMATFYKTYYGFFDRQALVDKLKKVKPAEIIREGKTYTSRKNTYSQEICKIYNVKRRNRLDIAKLA